MLNQLVVVGKCSREIEPFTVEDMSTFAIKVPRAYKTNNVEEEDVIECVIPNSFLGEVSKHIKLDTIVGIRGYLRNFDGNLRVYAERLTFLSSKEEE